MYPAITLTILILMLLHSSVNRNHHKPRCEQNEIGEQDNCTLLSHSSRPELRELSQSQLSNFINIFNSTCLDEKIDQKFQNHNQALTPLLDDLLATKSLDFLMPYWDFRLDYNLPVPSDSIIFHAAPFRIISSIQSQEHKDEENANRLFKSMTETIFDKNDKIKWTGRKNAYDMLDQLNAGILWKVLFYIAIENELDNVEESKTCNVDNCANLDKWNKTRCDQNPWLFWNLKKESCVSRIALGKRCVGFEKTPKTCYESECRIRKCRSIFEQSTTTPSITTTSTSITATTTRENSEQNDPLFEILNQSPIEVEEIPTNFTLEPVNEDLEKKNDTKVYKAELILEETLFPLLQEESTTTKPELSNAATTKTPTAQETPIEETTRTETLLFPTKTLDYTTTGMNYLYGPKPKNKKHRKNRKKKYEDKDLKRKNRKKKRKFPTTTQITTLKPIIFPATQQEIPTTLPPLFIEDIVPFTETNWHPMPPANEDTNLDSLLSLLPTPSMPEGTIRWQDEAPFSMVYFTITVTEGYSHRKEGIKKRAQGARIYLMGLNMPSGYTQITEGWQMKRGHGALVRTLDPEIAGPFVEFKIRVENRYGSPCKQLCLDAKQRYRRCARKVLRLSDYKKFSDPIQYYKNSTMAMNSQWTGRGYYRKRKSDYILFKCE